MRQRIKTLPVEAVEISSRSVLLGKTLRFNAYDKRTR